MPNYLSCLGFFVGFFPWGKSPHLASESLNLAQARCGVLCIQLLRRHEKVLQSIFSALPRDATSICCERESLFRKFPGEYGCEGRCVNLQIHLWFFDFGVVPSDQKRRHQHSRATLLSLPVQSQRRNNGKLQRSHFSWQMKHRVFQNKIGLITCISERSCISLTFHALKKHHMLSIQHRHGVQRRY